MGEAGPCITAADRQEQVENGRFTEPDVTQEVASTLAELFG
jgi:hypothetical protein